MFVQCLLFQTAQYAKESPDLSILGLTVLQKLPELKTLLQVGDLVPINMDELDIIFFLHWYVHCTKWL